MRPSAPFSGVEIKVPQRGEKVRLQETVTHNAKEAFTVRDGSGSYFRASVTEYDGKGGRAVAYERMSRSPEPTVDLTLACAVLARQRMHLVMQKATELGVTLNIVAAQEKTDVQLGQDDRIPNKDFTLEYTVADARWCFPIPAGYDDLHAAPLLCAGITTYSPLVRASIKKGDKVGVAGIGGLVNRCARSILPNVPCPP